MSLVRRETALKYAGVSAHDVRRCRDLSPERIKQLNRSLDRALYEAAVRHFSCWRNALTAAGVNLANVSHRKPKHLDREGMILWLRNRQASGQSLVFSEVCLENRDFALAIRREFRSWQRAVEESLVLPGGES